MSLTENFDRWMERETAALEILEELLDRLQADIEWFEALDEQERAREVIGYKA